MSGAELADPCNARLRRESLEDCSGGDDHDVR